jgi:coenzyme F420 hydrogenase subunit beta
VGSARSSEGWAIDKKWNQVIVRTQLGQTLMNLAREHRVLEFKKVPPENLEKLKKASMNKKRQCINALIEKSGSQDDLIYLDISDKW